MAEQTLGDGPVEEKYRDTIRGLANGIDEILNGPPSPDRVRKHGFVLMMFPFGEGGRCNYISNARREDILSTLKEQVARFEGMPEVPETRA